MYHETIPTAQLVYRVALVMQEYTQSGGVPIVIIVHLIITMSRLHTIFVHFDHYPRLHTIFVHFDHYQVRPFGVSLLICGWDEPGKPLLFQVRFL